MLSRGSIPQVADVLSWALTTAVLGHAIISIDLLISTYKGGKKQKGKHYPKFNVGTLVQRIAVFC